MKTIDRLRSASNLEDLEKILEESKSFQMAPKNRLRVSTAFDEIAKKFKPVEVISEVKPKKPRKTKTTSTAKKPRATKSKQTSVAA